MGRKKMTVWDYVIAALFGGIIIIVGAQVFFRYILNNSLTWSEEVARYVYTWITLLGAAIAIEKGTHVRIDFLIEKLPLRMAKYVRTINYTIMTAFLVFISITGFLLVKATENTRSTALSLPLNYVFYASLPVTALLGIYFSIKTIIKTLKVNKAADTIDDKGR